MSIHITIYKKSPFDKLVSVRYIIHEKLINYYKKTNSFMKNVLILILKRWGASLITIFVISIIIFIGIELLPGDVAETVLGQSATPETVAAFRKELKLDLPPHIRYGAWLNDFVHGNFGNSLANGRPVAELIRHRISNTLFLAMSTAIIAVPLAIFLGMLAAFYRNTFFDKLISTTTLSFISFPEFFVAYILIAFLWGCMSRIRADCYALGRAGWVTHGFACSGCEVDGRMIAKRTKDSGRRHLSTNAS